MYRKFLFLFIFSAMAHANAIDPCPPSTVAVEGGTSSTTPCGSGNGVVNGELFSTDFATGTLGQIFSGGGFGDGGGPKIISDPTSLSGRSLQFEWVSGPEMLQAVWHTLPGTHRKLHVRIRLKQGPGGSNDGIQKIMRFRPDVGGEPVPGGTINFQWGDILFFGDNYGNGQNHVASNRSTRGPDTFVNRWRYLEMMLDYTDPSVQHFAIWVDGLKVLDKQVPLTRPVPSNLNLNAIMFLSTFNAPATNRFDYIDKVDISAGYMGLP